MRDRQSVSSRAMQYSEHESKRVLNISDALDMKSFIEQ